MPGEAAVADINVHIDAYNGQRPGIHQRCVTYAWIAMGVYCAVAGWLFILVFNLDTKGKAIGLVGGLAIMGGYYLWGYVWKPLKDHQLTLRYRLFPQIFGFIEKVQYSHAYQPGFLDHLKRLKLIDFTSSENDDLIKGRHDGMDFELVETKLILGSGKNKETVFSGIIFHFRLETEFPGMLVAAKRGNWLQRAAREFWRAGSYDELSSGNRQLDETHEFRSDNFGAARPVIAGPLISVLTWLGNEWHGGDVRIALSHGDGYLMLPADRDYFRLPDLTQDVRYDWDVKPIVREMATLLAVAHVVRQVG
ncbi:DUF3137 domain-containing protein [Rhizobium sp.]